MDKQKWFERQQNLVRTDRWFQKIEKERPWDYYGIVVAGALVILILARLLKMGLNALARLRP